MRKNSFLVELTKKHNKYPSKAGLDLLYSPTKKFPGVLRQSVNNITRIFNGRAQRFFVPRFYHDRRNINFLRELKFKGEKKKKLMKNIFLKIIYWVENLYKYYSPGNCYKDL